MRKFLSEALGSSYEISFWPNGKDIFSELNSKHHNLVILDLQIKQKNPFDLLDWLKTALSHIPVIVTSRTEKAEQVVNAVKNGAFDFVVKPCTAARIHLAVQKALENIGLKSEIDYLRHEQDVIYDFNRIIAFSPSMKKVVDDLRKYSKTDTTILMTGETGTGKSFLAGSIHFNSHRRNKPFVKINCSNIPENLLESELFGHEKGAFTGADKLRVGRFEQAHGGTIFLDEIGELSMPLQGKLLRVLEEKAFERLGGNQTIDSDIRVSAATNINLEEQIAGGLFREDLYYRINALTVHLPPLRKRRECIVPLAYLMLQKTCRSLKKKIDGLSPDVIQMFESYAWPGNIRQLANIIERAVILEEEPVIRKESLSLSEPVYVTRAPKAVDSLDSLKASEKTYIMKALEESLWVQKDAADILGITPRALNYKIKKLGITHPRWRKNR